MLHACNVVPCTCMQGIVTLRNMPEVPEQDMIEHCGRNRHSGHVGGKYATTH